MTARRSPLQAVLASRLRAITQDLVDRGATPTRAELEEIKLLTELAPLTSIPKKSAPSRLGLLSVFALIVLAVLLLGIWRLRSPAVRLSLTSSSLSFIVDRPGLIELGQVVTRVEVSGLSRVVLPEGPLEAQRGELLNVLFTCDGSRPCGIGIEPFSLDPGATNSFMIDNAYLNGRRRPFLSWSIRDAGSGVLTTQALSTTGAMSAVVSSSGPTPAASRDFRPHVWASNARLELSSPSPHAITVTVELPTGAISLLTAGLHVSDLSLSDLNSLNTAAAVARSALASGAILI